MIELLACKFVLGELPFNLTHEAFNYYFKLICPCLATVIFEHHTHILTCANLLLAIVMFEDHVHIFTCAMMILPHEFLP